MPADFAASAITALAGPGAILAEAARTVPSVPGLYAIHADADAWEALDLGAPQDDRPLYVGKSEDSLADRDVKTHFGLGRTGQSTVRRSLAALLRETLGLRGQPRNPERPERFANYGLSAEHDAMLGTWMAEHLRMAVWPRPVGAPALATVEDLVIAHWTPPMNLERNAASPWRTDLKAARKAMADDARAWARERGHRA